jgi:hypothetical protein
MKTVKDALFGLVGLVVGMFALLYLAIKTTIFLGQVLVGFFINGYQNNKK